MRLLYACMTMGLFSAGSPASPPESLAGGSAMPTLKVGDPAPPLSIQAWVTDSPVDLAAGKGKACYAIWFWKPGDVGSVQHTPRLTILQNRYADKGLKIVGVVTESEMSTMEVVRKHVTDAGPKLGWTVAYDNAKETWVAWIAASLKPGEAPALPRMFLVDRQGIIAWIGTPADPDFEDIIMDVVDGRHSIATWEKAGALWSALGGFVNRREFDRAQSQLDEILREYPASSKAINGKVMIYAQQMRDSGALRDWSRNYLEAYARDPHVMHRLAAALSRSAVQVSLADRDPQPAFRAARIAYETGKSTDLLGDVAPLYARNLKEIGAVRQAVDVLADACNRLQGFERDQLAVELEFYRKCLTAQAELDSPVGASASKGAEVKAPQPAPMPPAGADGKAAGGGK